MACGSSSSSRHRGADPSSTSATTSVPPQTRTIIEYRKDGAVSKMRSHKGNIPVLPQTKLCPQCPAKFTRTTHLNRHLRTHTGDRSHRCDTCDAQFTRSDLLTRHKKTCGDSSHANRTRRRSCQACADSKVKCDLQRPCSKCLARGKECMFVIRPSRSTVGGIAPQLSTTTVERASDAEDRAATLIQTAVQHVASPSSKSYASSDHHLSIDQQTKSDCHWAAAPSVAASDGIVPKHDAASPSSPLERYSSGSPSDLAPTAPSGAVSSQNPFATMYSGDLLEPFFSSVFTGYNTSSPHLSSDNSLTPNDPVIASPTSSVDDPLTYTTPSAEVHHHPYHPSGESIYYATPSDQQVQDVISKEHMHLRQRYAQDRLMPSFSGPIHTLKHEFLEEHYHTVDSSSAPSRTRVRMAGPYQAFGSTRRALRESYSGQMQTAYPEPVESDFYGRNCEKPAGQTRLSASLPPTQHWHVSLEGETFESQPRYASDDQRYRPAYATCFVDNLQWNGVHAMRRQVIDPA